MSAIPEFDEWGAHSTARKMLCVEAKPHMRAVLAAIIDLAREADQSADRLGRLARALGSAKLAGLARERLASSAKADYLLGLNDYFGK